MIDVQNVQAKVSKAVDGLVAELAVVLKEYLRSQLGTCPHDAPVVRGVAPKTSKARSEWSIDSIVQDYVCESPTAVPMKAILDYLSSKNMRPSRHQLRRVLLNLIKKGRIELGADRTYSASRG